MPEDTDKKAQLRVQILKALEQLKGSTATRLEKEGLSADKVERGFDDTRRRIREIEGKAIGLLRGPRRSKNPTRDTDINNE